MGMGQNNLPLLNAKEVLTHSTLMHSKQKYFGAEIDWLTNMCLFWHVPFTDWIYYMPHHAATVMEWFGAAAWTNTTSV